MDEIIQIGQECNHRDWDGYDALPVLRQTVNNACLLAKSLPDDIPTPSIGAEPDGHISMDWHRSSRFVVSVSVGPRKEVCYAALIGSDEERGAELCPNRIPDNILGLIRQVLHIE